MIKYIADLPKGKVVLWCYLIWYLVTVGLYFDPSIYVWSSSVGISLIIGFALILSVSKKEGEKPEPWQTLRLFAMPFCVSSFSSLIKGQGYFLIFPPVLIEQILSIGFCLLFVAFVWVIKILYAKKYR